MYRPSPITYYEQLRHKKLRLGNYKVLLSQPKRGLVVQVLQPADSTWFYVQGVSLFLSTVPSIKEEELALPILLPMSEDSFKTITG